MQHFLHIRTIGIGEDKCQETEDHLRFGI